MSQHDHALAALSGFVLLGLLACQVAAPGAGASPAAAAPTAATPTAVATPSAPTADAAPAPAPSAVASATAPAIASSPPGLVLGPSPAGTPATEREATVARLLQTSDASKLPERAADADLPQDPDREAAILWRMRPEPGMVHPPKVRMGDFTVSAGLPPEIVKRIFRQNLGRVRLCYEKQLEKKPKLEGKMKLDFVITPAGEIQAPRASAVTLNEPTLFECIAKSTKDVTFPQPEANAPITVSVPISFAP
ncbi:MAG TPA: AgmX/PglI C-terminal domain-containing protein [Polyangiaceae bacterium]|nr:AgmX/PglI C-terminal domain-containing protein [Polyangiaceae bacterium]